MSFGFESNFGGFKSAQGKELRGSLMDDAMVEEIGQTQDAGEGKRVADAVRPVDYWAQQNQGKNRNNE